MPETDILDTFDPRIFRECCGRFATGITVITTRTPEGTHGMTVSAFMSVSLEPPLICVSLNRQSRMLGKIRDSGCYAVNILSKHMQAHAIHFAGKPDDTMKDLFQDLDGLPILRGAVATLISDVVRFVEAGDHVLVLGHVRHLDHEPAVSPLLYHAGQFCNLSDYQDD